MKLNNWINRIKRTIKIVYQCIRYIFNTSKWLFVLTILLIVISGMCVSGKIYIWRWIIDSGFGVVQGNMSYYRLALLMSAYFCVELVQTIVGQLQIFVSGIFSKVIDCDITEKTLSKIDQISVGHFEHSETYDMFTRVSEESTARSMSVMQALIQLSRGIIVLIGVSIILWSFSPWMVLLCVVTSLGIFAINNKFMNQWYLVFNSRLTQKRHIKILKAMCIKYENIKELRIFRATDKIKQTILETLKLHLKDDKAIRGRFFKEMTVMSMVDDLLTNLLKGWTLYRAIVLKTSVGQFMSYIQAMDVFKNTVDEVLSLCTQTYEDSLYMESFFELMRLELNLAGDEEIDCGEIERIECIDVSFRYTQTDQEVLQHFNYVFEKGKSYGLVGLNGSGKSTLLKLLLGLYDQYDGAILVNGIELRTLSLSNYYDRLSVIFQDFIKYPLDVKSNIIVSEDESKSLYSVEQAAKLSCADSFIRELPKQYDTVLGKEWTDGAELSIGQWQKVAVARAFYKRFDLMVMDEPTAAIDSDTEVEIFKSFSQIIKNKIGVVVTHRLSNIHFVDQILVLDQGKLIEHGTHETLMKQKGLYSKLYSEQASLYIMDIESELIKIG